VCNELYHSDCSKSEAKTLEKYIVDCNNITTTTNLTMQQALYATYTEEDYANTYLHRLFGNLVKEGTKIVRSTAINWAKNDSSNGTIGDCTASITYHYDDDTPNRTESWFDASWKGNYLNENYNHSRCGDLALYKDNESFSQTFYRAKDAGPATSALSKPEPYDGCRSMVIRVVGMQLGSVEKESIESRTIRTCATRQAVENSKEHSDDRLLEKGCKDLKNSKSEVTVCFCNTTLCNESPAGPQLVPILISALIILPFFF